MKTRPTAIQRAMFEGFGEGAARGGTIRDESSIGGLFDRSDETPDPEPVRAAIDVPLPFDTRSAHPGTDAERAAYARYCAL